MTDIVSKNREIYDRIWAQIPIPQHQEWPIWQELQKELTPTARLLELGSGVLPRIPVRGGYFADLSQAALRKLIDGDPGDAFNLGTGNGVTVKELLAAIEQVTGRKLPVSTGPRRPGDSPALVANPNKAKALLGWGPSRSLEDIVASAWRWHSEIEPK